MSDNSRNKTKYGDRNATYLQELPEGCIRFEFYNGNVFGHYFINPDTFDMYYDNDLLFRKLEVRQNGDYDIYCLRDVN